MDDRWRVLLEKEKDRYNVRQREIQDESLASHAAHNEADAKVDQLKKEVRRGFCFIGCSR